MTSSAKKAISAKTITTKRAEPATKKEVVAAVSSRDIDQQIKAFLSSGVKSRKSPMASAANNPAGNCLLASTL